ncbi:MAG: M48 family metalloprotease [Phycisphaerae bacterium]|nr:M48 family metalloprotease [Phycisphaerae bacterium]
MRHTPPHADSPDPSHAPLGEADAYPPGVTPRRLARGNAIGSALVVAGMLALGWVLGVVAGVGVELLFDPNVWADHGLRGVAPGALAGFALGLACSCAAACWAWFSGDRAILRLTGAQPLRPADDPLLFRLVDELSVRAGIPRPRVYLVDDSALNSFTTGRSVWCASLGVTTGLRLALSPEELRAVVGHEIAHIRHLDIRFGLVMATMVGLLVLACDGFLRLAVRAGPFLGRDNRDKSRTGGVLTLVFVALAVGLSLVAPLLAWVIQLAVSREREHLADAGAVALTGDAGPMIRALRRVAADTDPLVDRANRATAHLFLANPLLHMRETSQGIDTPFSSHPCLEKRIERLAAIGPARPGE